MRLFRLAALSSCALAAVLLSPTAALAQTDEALPFTPLETSAECTTGDPRDAGVTVAGDPDVVVTTRDRSSTHLGAIHARALGRSLVSPRVPEPGLGDAFASEGTRYAAASTRDGIAIFRIESKRRPRVSVLQVVSENEDSTGAAVWLPILPSDVDTLDRAALASNATTWSSVGDVAVDGDRLYIAVPDQHRVLALSLDDGYDRWGRAQAEVWSVAEADLNAPWAFAPPTSENSFTFPTQLGVDGDGFLYIGEDVDGDSALKSRGDDVWVASPSEDGAASREVGRLASLEDCDARLVGVHVAPNGTVFLRVARTEFFFGLVLKN